MKKKKVTLTVDYIDGLKDRIKNLEQELEDTKSDLRKHRNYFVGLLKQTLGTLGRGNSINSEWLAKDLAKHLNNVESWWWGV